MDKEGRYLSDHVVHGVRQKVIDRLVDGSFVGNVNAAGASQDPNHIQPHPANVQLTLSFPFAAVVRC